MQRLQSSAWYAALWLAPIACLTCQACQSIVGIQERELGSSVAGVSEDCYQYCDHVNTSCTELKKPAYIKAANCEAICGHFDSGNSTEDALTVACLEKQTGTLGEPDDCVAAGPSGGGRCGDRCDVFCRLYSRVCDAYPAGSNASECKAACGALEVGDDLDANASFNGVDTLQCRFAHLTAAALELSAGSEPMRQLHCLHARVNGYPGDKCIDKPPACPRYCKVVMQACVDNNLQYETPQQCMAVCAGFSTAEQDMQSTSSPSLKCRLQNAYSALETTSGEACTRAGLAGGGSANEACGSTCRGYCEQLSRACGSAGFEIFGMVDGVEACTKECLAMDHPAHTRRFKCRLVNIAKALSTAPNDRTLCDNAFGNGPCASNNMGQ